MIQRVYFRIIIGIAATAAGMLGVALLGAGGIYHFIREAAGFCFYMGSVIRANTGVLCIRAFCAFHMSPLAPCVIQRVYFRIVIGIAAIAAGMLGIALLGAGGVYHFIRKGAARFFAAAIILGAGAYMLGISTFCAFLMRPCAIGMIYRIGFAILITIAAIRAGMGGITTGQMGRICYNITERTVYRFNITALGAGSGMLGRIARIHMGPGAPLVIAGYAQSQSICILYIMNIRLTGNRFNIAFKSLIPIGRASVCKEKLNGRFIQRGICQYFKSCSKQGKRSLLFLIFCIRPGNI